MTSTVAVIGGGENAEHEVSLQSASAIAEALSGRGFTVLPLTIGRDGWWWLRDVPLGDDVPSSLAVAVGWLRQVDVVFPALHGPLGEDGTLAALCDLAHKPVVGSPLKAGAIAMDKWVTKIVANALGVATAPGRLVRAADIGKVEFRGAVVVKPVSNGSSYGVTKVEEASQLDAALRLAARYDDRILIETVINGREIDVAVLRKEDGHCWAAPPLEIIVDGIFDTTTKYDGSARFVVPAELEAGEEAALANAAITVFEALDCAGVARLDFFLTPAGLVLNEINTMPGLTPHSQVPQMFAAAGLAYADLVTHLVKAASCPQ
jgi:D-alanine-D-alanine ligase